MTKPFFDISTPRHMFEKATREFEKMSLDLNNDNIFNFFVTMYHIMDYVKAQGTVSQGAMDAMYNDPDFDMCSFICNKGKHLTLRRGDPFDTQHSGGAMLGVAEFGAFEFGEAPSYSLVAGGQVVNVLDLGRQMLQKWEKFLADNSL